MLKKYFSRYGNMDEKLEEVEAYPHTYKGNVLCKGITVENVETSEAYTSKEAALIELKAIAVLKNKDIVKDIEYMYEERTNGNYIYKEWRCKGKACSKK